MGTEPTTSSAYESATSTSYTHESLDETLTYRYKIEAISDDNAPGPLFVNSSDRTVTHIKNNKTIIISKFKIPSLHSIRVLYQQ